MELLETIKLSTAALKRNKSRSFLTMLGIIIGVFAVITLVSLGTGLKNYITNQFESLGSNILYVMPGKVGSEEGGFGGGPPNFSGSKLKNSLVKDIQRIGDPIVAVTGVIEVPANGKYRNQQKRITVIGGTPEVFSLLSLDLKTGRFFSNVDVESSRKVAVIGSEVVSKLFGDKDPLGEEIILSESRFRVIGTLGSRGAGALGGSADSVAYIPISSGQIVFGVTKLQEIIVKFSHKDKIDEAKYKIKSLLKRSLKEEDFSIINQAAILTTISAVLNVLTLALGGIAAISLLVGGIGIMNIMLVSVTERTREIGIRKSVGAKNADILTQFLIEAVFLSLVGGLIGIILGLLGVVAVSKLLSASAFSWWSVLLALGVSSLVGIVFGVAPAFKAAKLDPVESLRYE